MVIILFVCSLQISAQNYQTVEELDDACTQLGFASNEEAEIAVDRILDEFGLFRNFIIQECPDINNAVAKVIQVSENYKERYILYDNHFFDNMDSRAGTDWASMSILAHEIGHHLNGHSLNDEGSNHQFELEADYFSGSALAKLGATLEQAQSAIQTLRYEKATRTHPAKADRLIAIANGWMKASGGQSVVIENIEEDNIVLFGYDENLISSYQDLGLEAYNAENYRTASDYFLKAFQYTNGTDCTNLYYAASSEVAARDYSRALYYYLAIVRNEFKGMESDKRVEIYKNIGLIFIEQNRLEEAEKFFDFALRNNPNDYDILRARANLSYRKGDLRSYLLALERLLINHPNDEELLYNLGVVNTELGNLTEAENYYDKALFINPRYKNALTNKVALILGQENEIIAEMNGLGTSEADNRRYDQLKIVRGNLYRKAIPYLERLIMEEGIGVEIYDTLYNIYSVLGDSENMSRIKRLKNRI